MAAKLVIVGAGGVAEVAFEYFSEFSDYEVVGFSIDEAFIRQSSLFNLPVVPFHVLEDRFPPANHAAFVAMSYSQINRLRRRFVDACLMKGYELASFISPLAMVAKSAKIARHAFILEGNVIQPFVEVGENVIMWSGNHIGHHTKIEQDVFIASHVVVSGNCIIRAGSFLGVNATVSNGVELAVDNWLGPGAVVSKSTLPGQLFPGQISQASKVSTYKLFKPEIIDGDQT